MNALDNFARLLFSIILACVVLAILGFATAVLYNPQPDTRFYGLLLYSGTPEPKERAVFLVVIFMAPIASWLSWRVWDRLAGWPARTTRLLVWAALTVIAAGEILIVSRSEFLHLTAAPALSSGYTKALATAVGIALALYVILRPEGYGHGRTRLPGRAAAIILISIGLISIGIVHAASRIHTLNTLQVPGWGQTAFEAVFYSVSQVANGKTILADLPAQYGLYAELLRPALSGSSTVLRFTTTMAILELLAWLGILFAARILVRSNLLFLLAGLALSTLVGEMWLYGINAADPYYQYWPIRLIFPCLATVVFILYLFRRHQSTLSLTLLGCIAAAACIWNLDSGVPVLGATAAYLLSHVIAPPRRTSRIQATTRLLWMVTVWAATLAAFFVYLRLKAGRPLDWRQLFEYQKVFYSAGINLLPMPVSFHPWVLVGVVYVSAILIYISYLHRRKADRFSALLFFLSILGVGLFAYYQGRSHEWVFTIVIWPAVLIGFALLDRIRRICVTRLLPRATMLAAAPIVILAALLGWSSFQELPRIVGSVMQNQPGKITPSGAKLEDAIVFIRKNTVGRDRAIILSYHQATYFGETRLASAIGGPGIIEMVFRSDWERFVREVLQAQDVPVFVDLDAAGHVDQAWRWILPKYRIVDCSPLESVGKVSPISNVPISAAAQDAGCTHLGS